MRQLAIALWIGVAVTCAAAAPFTLVSGSFQRTVGNPGAWSVNQMMTIRWASSGTPPANQTVSILLQVGSSVQTVLAGMKVPANQTTGAATVPAPASFFKFTQTTTGTLILRNDLNSSMALTMPVTIVYPGTAPPPSTAAPAVNPSARLRPVAVSTLTPAAQVWPNKSPLPVTWDYAGTAPNEQTVIVTWQAGGKSWDLGNPVFVSFKNFTITARDWATVLKTTTSGTLTLIDATSRIAVSPAASVTVRIP